MNYQGCQCSIWVYVMCLTCSTGRFFLLIDPAALSILQDNPPALQAILSGEIIVPSAKESQRQGQRERALAMLHQMIEDAHMGKRQFLSGTSCCFCIF